MDDTATKDQEHDPADDIDALEALAEQYDIAESDRKMIVSCREFVVRLTPGANDGDFDASDRIKFARDKAVIAALECASRVFRRYLPES